MLICFRFFAICCFHVKTMIIVVTSLCGPWPSSFLDFATNHFYGFCCQPPLILEDRCFSVRGFLPWLTGPHFKALGTHSSPLHDLAVYTSPRDHGVDKHKAGRSCVFLVRMRQKDVYPQDHILHLWPSKSLSACDKSWKIRLNQNYCQDLEEYHDILICVSPFKPRFGWIYKDRRFLLSVSAVPTQPLKWYFYLI
jgi:hypothetical protein